MLLQLLFVKLVWGDDMKVKDLIKEIEETLSEKYEKWEIREVRKGSYGVPTLTLSKELKELDIKVGSKVVVGIKEGKIIIEVL